MGFQALSQCFPTAQAAAAAECATYPRTSSDAATLYTWSCSGSSSDGSSLSLVRTDSGGGSAAVTQVLSFPSCDENMAYTDMGQVWAIGIGACALVWALKTFVLKLTLPQ